MLTKDIKLIIDCIRKDTMSFDEKIHCENLLIAELERIKQKDNFKVQDNER